MDLISIQQHLQQSIKELDKTLKKIKERAEVKAKSQGEYEKELAKTLIQLKNGVEFELEGVKIQSPPASTSEKIARGICFREKIQADLAEAEYKNIVEGLRATQSKITAYQSMNKYLDKI